MFEGFTISRQDVHDAYSKLRLQRLGLWNDIVVFVLHTARGNADHVILIRKAEKHENCIQFGSNAKYCFCILYQSSNSHILGSPYQCIP